MPASRACATLSLALAPRHFLLLHITIVLAFAPACSSEGAGESSRGIADSGLDVLEADPPDTQPESSDADGDDGEDAADAVSEAADDAGADAPDDVYPDADGAPDADGGPQNHPPVADASQWGPPFRERTVKLDGTQSHDPDPGDTIESYAWTWSWGGQTFTSTEAKLEIIIPCSESSVTFELVVTDNHGATSTPSLQTVTLGDIPEVWVSINDCVPGDECGYVERPWCSITAGFEARRDHGEPLLNVVKGRYEQGRTEIGGMPIAAPGETLDWTLDNGEFIDLYTYDEVNDWKPQGPSCEDWATDPKGVVVVTSEPDGWRIAGEGNLEARGVCIIGRPMALPPVPRFRAVSLLAGYVMLADSEVHTDTVPAPYPEESVAVFCDGRPCHLGGAIVVGSAQARAVGVQIGEELAGDFEARGSLYSSTIQFADGASAAETVGFEARNCFDGGVEGSVIDGGPGHQRSTGISFVNCEVDSKVLNSVAFGRGSHESIGIRVQGTGRVDALCSHFIGRAPSSEPIVVENATGVWAIDAPIDLRENEIEGTGENVTATVAARGLHVQDLESTMYLALAGTTRGGRSLRDSVGVDLDAAAEVCVLDHTIVGGSVDGSLVGVATEPSVAAGIRARNGSHVELRQAVVRGCDPHCTDHGVALEGTEQPSLLGVGLLIDDTTAGTSVELDSDTRFEGGSVQKSHPSLPSQAELIGMYTVGWPSGGTTVDGTGAGFIGSIGGTDRPRRSAGIRAQRGSISKIPIRSSEVRPSNTPVASG